MELEQSIVYSLAFSIFHSGERYPAEYPNVWCITRFFHSAWWEHKLFLVPCELWRLFPLVLLNCSFPDFWVVFLVAYTKFSPGAWRGTLHRPPELSVCAALLSSLALCSENSCHLDLLGLPHSASWLIALETLQMVSWSHCRAPLICFSSLGNHYPVLSNIQCLKIFVSHISPSF